MNSAPQLRTLIALGRVANLPTIWSNGLAGWWLGGGGNYWKLPFLLLGLSLLYTGGAYLNDASDADFDRQRRPERPIPTGKIPVKLVWRLGFGQLVAGIFLLLFCSQLAAGAAILLALTILLYNVTHQFFTASPWLLGACRFWVYVSAGATGAFGLNGWPIFCGLAMALYVAGSNYLAPRGNVRTAPRRWPLLLLAAPLLLAFTMNTGTPRTIALGFAGVPVGWLIYCLRSRFQPGDPGVVRRLPNLTAGIVLVDWLAIAPQCSHWFIPGFLMLFGATIMFQKLVPATRG